MKMKNTIRYCRKCRELTIFIYNKAIDHGECSECSSRFALKNNLMIKKLLTKSYDNKLERIDEWYKEQMQLYGRLCNELRK